MKNKSILFTTILMVLAISSIHLFGQEKAIIDVPQQITFEPFFEKETPGSFSGKVTRFSPPTEVEEILQVSAKTEKSPESVEPTRGKNDLISAIVQETGTVTDHEGNLYNTVLIDDRWWMAENLMVATYANHDSIPDGTGVTEFDHEAAPAYYFYYDDDAENESIYGKLYTWHAATDSRGICPAGWYIPTREDWENLRDHLHPNAEGNDNIAGGKMKTTGTLEDGTGLWRSPNLGATNESGFSSLPGGFFNNSSFADPLFYMMGERAAYITSTEFNPGYVIGASNHYDTEALFLYTNHHKSWGSSVRCIQKTTETAELPTVVTMDAQSVYTYAATIIAEVVDDGGVSVANRGFYLSTSPDPGEQDTRLYLGSGSGMFEANLQDLRPTTTYYYRAYAQNTVGKALGEVKSFTTGALDEDLAMLIASTSFLNYWQAIKGYNASMTGDMMANHSTGSWGNFAWADASHEPRTPWDNTPEYQYALMTLSVWNDLYELIQYVNDVIYAIEEEDLEVGTNGMHTQKVLATMYFIRGVSHGQIGLTFDQAWIAQGTDAPALQPLSPWNDVIDAGIDDLEQAIFIAGNHDFIWNNNEVNGMLIDDEYLGGLSASYAARFLALGSRTAEQNESLSWTSYDWSDVLDFANNGITQDFAPVGDGLPWMGGVWYDLQIKYLRNPGWGRVDMRIVNLLDPDQPVRFPTDNQGFPITDALPDNGMAFSDDARLSTDFQYLPNHNFNPNRGGWYFSHYRHSRYDYPATTNYEGYHMGESLGPLRELRVYDNELMKAEALIRSAANVGEAAAILNHADHPRKARGELADVPATQQAVMDAIFYERDIELFHNGYLIAYSDMRRRDLLQQGTPLHFPVPGAILELLDEENYTFGGYFNADGINTSEGGDWIRPYYHFAEVNIEISGTGNTMPPEGAHLINKGFKQFYATPELGWVFDKWVVDQTDHYYENLLEIDIEGDMHIEAIFVETQEPQYALSLSVEGAGSIFPDSGTYYLEEGETIDLEAMTDDDEWFFVHWTTQEGVEVSHEASFTFTMPATDVALVAHFDVFLYHVDISVYPSGGGSITGAGQYMAGEEVVLTAIASEGYRFVGWFDSPFCYHDLSDWAGDAYQQNYYGDALDIFHETTIDHIATTVNTIRINNFFDWFLEAKNVDHWLPGEGDEGNLYLHVDCSYPHFSGQAFLGATEYYNYYMYYSGEFNEELNTITIYYDVYEDNFLWEDFTSIISYDEKNKTGPLSVEAISAERYKGQSAAYDKPTAHHGMPERAKTDVDTLWVFTMPSQDIAYTAVFMEKHYALNVEVIPENAGSVTIEPQQDIFAYGETVTLTATPNEGYVFVSWRDGQGYEVSVQPIFSFGMPGHDYHVKAHFQVEVSVDEDRGDEFVIYPNPAIEKVFISNCHGLQKVELFAVTGHKIYQAEVSLPEHSFDVSGFSAGVYLLKLTSADGMQHISRLIIGHR